jgi:polyisoprenoid-binding protein YceI
MPSADFSIDDAAARRAEGADFATPVGPDAIEGTRNNMLGAAVLDAARFPLITLKSVAIGEAAGTLSATAQLDVAGHTSNIVVPLTLERQPARLAVRGSVRLRQSALGLTPFSVMLGALQVQDEIAIRFTIVATSPKTG